MKIVQIMDISTKFNIDVIGLGDDGNLYRLKEFKSHREWVSYMKIDNTEAVESFVKMIKRETTVRLGRLIEDYTKEFTVTSIWEIEEKELMRLPGCGKKSLDEFRDLKCRDKEFNLGF